MKKNPSHKGVSLSVETVIVLILAAAVLVALLFFFTDIFTKGKGDVSLFNQQREKCSAYVRANLKCDQKTHEDSTRVTEAIKKELLDVCKKMPGYALCTGTSLTIQCVQQCCSGYCATALKSCAELNGQCAASCQADRRISEGDWSCTSPQVCCKKT